MNNAGKEIVAEENNCFAYTAIDGLPGHGECFALRRRESSCGTVGCPFYKPNRNYIRCEEKDFVYFKYNGWLVGGPIPKPRAEK